MSSPVTDLERAIAAFRREQGLNYLRVLGGQALDPRFAYAARASWTSERGLELLDGAKGELSANAYAAACAHLARAVFEQRYQRARREALGLVARQVSVEGETRSLESLTREWSATRSASERERRIAAITPALEQFVGEQLEARAHADAALAELFTKLQPPRHPDAGPASGASTLAESWLAQTHELTREAIAHARIPSGPTGFEVLWHALGQEMHGLFAREGRLRRLALEWEPLGLRRLLSARARAAVAHPGPLVGAQLVVLSAPDDLRVAQSEYEYGLASELALVETIGRAVAYVHASPALPLSLRFATVGTVARSLGSLAVQRYTDPRFLRRARGLSQRESEQVARRAALWFLLDSRLTAAAQLTRGLPVPAAGSSGLDAFAAPVERALQGSVPRGPAAALVLRASPGGALRGKLHGPALAWTMRERFDEDWDLNPRAAEPLRGALARAGELSIEAWAEELGTNVERGVEKLAELF